MSCKISKERLVVLNVNERFWSKVKKTDSCWIWTGYRDKDGYGRFGIDEKIKHKAHRFSYELVNGKIPNNQEIDHLCKNTSCVNPDHLEIVTHQENIKRSNVGINQSSKTHCPQGHEFTKENTYYRKDRFGRGCQTCINERSIARRKTHA